MKRFFLNRPTPVAQALARGTKGYKSYYVAYYKGDYANLAVDNAEIFTAFFEPVSLESSGWVTTPRSARRSPLDPLPRRRKGSGGREFLDSLPPSLRLLVLVVCVKGVHKSPLETFQGFHPIQPLQARLKRAESVQRAFTKLSLDSPTKNVQKRQGEVLRGSQGIQAVQCDPASPSWR